MNREDIIRMARQSGSLIEAAQEKDLLWLERFAALVTSAAIKEILAQPDYKSTYDYQLMENAQGELERIKLVQTGVGIEQRAEEAYEAAKQRSWVGVSDEVAQPEQEPVTWRYKIVDVFGRPAWTLKTPKSDTRVLESQPLYTTPPQRKPLSDEEILTYKHMIDWTAEWSYINFARAIEAAIWEKLK